jgi:hypothetical protein
MRIEIVHLYFITNLDHLIGDIMMGSDEESMPDLVTADSADEINAVATSAGQEVHMVELVVHAPVATALANGRF